MNKKTEFAIVLTIALFMFPPTVIYFDFLVNQIEPHLMTTAQVGKLLILLGAIHIISKDYSDKDTNAIEFAIEKVLALLISIPFALLELFIISILWS